MVPFIRRSKGLSDKEGILLKGIVLGYENLLSVTAGYNPSKSNPHGNTLCMTITNWYSEWKCSVGNLKTLDELDKSKAKKYAWIQNPLCYARFKNEKEKECEILVYRGTNTLNV